MEQEKNHQITDNSASYKKKIEIPPITQVDPPSDIVKVKRDQVNKAHQRFGGYLKLQEDPGTVTPPLYELENEDIKFLRQQFPKDFQAVSSDLGVSNSNIAKDFVKIIDYLDNTRDLTMKSLGPTGSKINRQSQQSILDFWEEKTKRTKYPLIRKYWNANISKQDFGKLDPYKIAFRDREPEKGQRPQRNNRRMAPREVCTQLQNIQSSFKVLDLLMNMTLRREKLKLGKVLSRYDTENAFKSSVDDALKDIDKELEQGQILYRKYNPEPSEESFDEEPTVPQVVEPVSIKTTKELDNDLAFLFSSVISELDKVGFELKDMRCDNLPAINNRIKSLRQSQGSVQTTMPSDKIFSVNNKPQKMQVASFVDMTGYKRFSFDTTHDIFLEKIKPEKLRGKESELNKSNLIHDYQLKQMLPRFNQESSLFRVNAASGFNPDVYWDNGNYSTSNCSFENFKNWKFVKSDSKLPIFEDLGDLTTDFKEKPEQLNLKAEAQVKDMRLKSGFSNWLNNR